MKQFFPILVLIPSLLFAQTVWNGTADTTWYTNNKEKTEYTITTAEQLAGLAGLVNGGESNGTYDMSGKTIKLGADIILNDTAANGGWQNWNETAGLTRWTAIGSNNLPFQGTFDGDGHIVSGVYINSAINDQGLFGYSTSNGTIKNLGVVASYIKGNFYVGGLVGRNYGTIVNSYATGNVVGTQYVGGLVGRNYGTIVNSYATGNVTGSIIGGLVGDNQNGSTISNSYATGSVSGTGNYAGGLVGFNLNTISNGYYDSQTSGRNDTDKGTPKTTEYMQSEEFVLQLNDYAVFQEIASAKKWEYNAGGYPKLSSESFNLADFFESGDGSEGSPYIIKNKQQLTSFARIVNLKKDNFANKYVALGADIKLNDTTGWEEWNENSAIAQWTPIGGYTSANVNAPFNGTFDGAGHIISGMYISVTSNYQGLFGYAGYDGTIKNLGMKAFYVKGGQCVGGLAASGTITNSYAIGNVSGTNTVGGLAGSGTITNSYFIGNVSGTNTVGGLAGSGSMIINSYAVGKVQGGYNVGGLVGSGYRISNSYYNSETSELNDIDNGIPKTTEYMQSEEFVEVLRHGAGILSAQDWVYAQGQYPTLGNAIAPSVHVFASGEGTEKNPYIIETKPQLEDFSLIVTSGKDFMGEYIKLGANIAINDTTDWQSWNETTEGLNQWTGIYWFSGTFGGDGYVISGIYGSTGLFGGISSSGTIKNLGVVASYIYNGNINTNYVGGLVGHIQDNGTVSDSYFMGNVIGRQYVGGLVGYSYGTISNSYATGNVSGTVSGIGGLAGGNSGTIISSYATGNASGTYVGGLVGDNSGVISNTYAKVNVMGDRNVGGLVGTNYGNSIINSYATGNVTGSSNVGGLLGVNYGGGTISNSYYNRETSGQTDVGKGDGKTTAQMQTTSTFINWDFEEIWGRGGMFNNGTPYLQWQSSMRQVQVQLIDPQPYTGSKITPTPKATATNGTELKPGVDFDYEYGENIYISTGGTVTLVGKTDVYFGTKTVSFEIVSVPVVSVTWEPSCDTTFTYNGKPQGTKPSAPGYSLTWSEFGTDAGNYTITASSTDVTLNPSTCSYKIAKKPIEVTWDMEPEYVYNKMTQGPTASIAEPGIDLRVVNTYSGVGKYTAANGLAPFAQIISANANNYELVNYSVDYEIKPKPLKPYFSTTLSTFEYNIDTLWVPSEVIADSAALQQILEMVVGYDGFATDTVSKESDNISVLRGQPKISIEYLPETSKLVLSKRVETTQKATATIVTQNVSADNYNVLSRPIVIMETMEDAEETEKIDCYRGSYCTALSEEVCLFIEGKEVENCATLRISCTIDNRCMNNMLISECTGIGGIAAESCEVPIRRQTFSGGSFRIWQTASGVVNVDLGYMPAAPVTLKIYDLKGKLIATERVNTRFANIKVYMPSGVYLFKAGNRSSVKQFF